MSRFRFRRREIDAPAPVKRLWFDEKTLVRHEARE